MKNISDRSIKIKIFLLFILRLKYYDVIFIISIIYTFVQNK